MVESSSLHSALSANLVLGKLRAELAELAELGEGAATQTSPAHETLEESISNLAKLKEEHASNMCAIERIMQRDPSNNAAQGPAPNDVAQRRSFARPLIAEASQACMSSLEDSSDKQLQRGALMHRSYSNERAGPGSRCNASAIDDIHATTTATLPLRRNPRPSSAPPRRRPRVTVPQPFSFEMRTLHQNSSMRRLRAEMETDKLRLEAGRAAVRPVPVPATTAPGLYQAKVDADEEASRQRRTVVRTLVRPFSFSNPRSSHSPGASSHAEKAAGGDSGEGGSSTFTARDVPKAMSEPRYEWMQLEDARRRERVAQVGALLEANPGRRCDFTASVALGRKPFALCSSPACRLECSGTRRARGPVGPLSNSESRLSSTRS